MAALIIMTQNSKKKAAAKKTVQAVKKATVKKVVAAKKATPVKKTAPAKKTTPVKKTVSAKKVVPVEKPVPAKKAAAVKKVASTKKAAPVKKAAAPKKPVPAKKAVAVKKSTVPTKTPVKKAAAPKKKAAAPAKAAPVAELPAAELPIVSETTVAPEVITFAQLGLPDKVVRAVSEKGYTRPTPIQVDAIPVLMAGKDIVGGSQTGTGKTAAFALPILGRLGEHKSNHPRVLILEPTRELAQQVIEQLTVYGKYTGLTSVLLHGGVGYGKQNDALKRGVDIVVATPGRLLDHLNQKTFSLKALEILVLDEADRMLDMGFMPDVKRILRLCPPRRQSMLFSATIPPAIERLAQTMLRDPVQIRIGGGRQPATTIKHYIYPVDDRQKFDLLNGIIKQLDFHSMLVFTRTKNGADIVARWLEAAGHGKVGVLHADRTQREREEALKAFKEGRCDVLVATDIVARGIDISDVSHVINYDIPLNPEDYVHRIGRTGRAEKDGDAITLVTADESDALRAIERFINQEIPRKKIEGFDYNWTPMFDEGKAPKKKKRNRGYHSMPTANFGRR